MTATALWVGEICMAFGLIAFTLKSFRAREGDKHHYLTSILILMVATASYFAMAIGQTHITLSDGHSIFVARYIDWAITTPLLILGTATIGVRAYSADKTRIYAAMGADIFMIVTGFAGAVSVDSWRWVWYGFSCVAFVAVLAILWGPLRRQASRVSRGSAYTRLITVLTLLWVQYPMVWLFGDEGVRVLPPSNATVWYTVLDVTAKVVFGFLSLAAVDAAQPMVEATIPLVSAKAETTVKPASVKRRRPQRRR